MPLPEPLLPLVMVSQLALLEAVHGHAVPADTVTLAMSPPTAMVWLVGLTVNTHALGSCLMFTILPAIVTAPVRENVVVFATADTVTVPLPEPLLPLPIVNQFVLLEAVQLQVFVVVTEKFAEPPLPGTVPLVGDTLNEQFEALWVTVTDWPATVNEPVRDEVVLLAAAV